MEPIEQAKKDIDKAAAEAVRVIASAAREASHVVANATAEAVKVASLQSSSDHDILNSLVGSVFNLDAKFTEKFNDLKADIKDIKDGTSNQILDQERRISNLELWKSERLEWGKSRVNESKLIIGLGLLILGLIIWHLTGYKL